jgi:dolichyl-phosphate beta-glucosyltransferase
VTPPIDLSVVIPAYNEAGRIGPTLDRLIAALDPLPLPWEILVADDGSIDGTAAIVDAAAAREPRVRVLRLPHRGKGATLRDGLLAAVGARRFLCDADLSMPPAQIGRFLAVLPSQCDIAIGSREGAGAVRIGEPMHRHLLGRVFNTLVRAMVLPGIQDTQCGFKLFTAEAVESVLPTTAIDGWSFDVELLASARAQGWRILEVPIEWHYGQASRLRVLPHSFEMLRDLFHIRAKVRRGAFARPSSVVPPEPRA